VRLQTAKGPTQGAKSTFKRSKNHVRYRHLKSGTDTRVATVVVQTFPRHLYFHGVLSLVETVVPVLVAKVTIELTYKNGAKMITTRLPVIEVNASNGDMFSQDNPVEVQLEAQKANGDVAGKPLPGGDVNSATGTVTLMPGQRKQIDLRIVW
jgi:hypothetical protein